MFRRRPSSQIYQPENLGYPIVRSSSVPNSPTQKLATIQRHATLDGAHHHPRGSFTPCMDRAYHPMTRTLRTTASRDGKYTHVWELRHQPQCTMAAMATTQLPEQQQQQQQQQQQPNVVPQHHHVQQQHGEQQQQQPIAANAETLHRCTCGQQQEMANNESQPQEPPPPKMCAEPDVILLDGSCMPHSFSTFKPVRSDHIYESPKFETFKAGGVPVKRGPTVVFELDAKKQNRQNETAVEQRGST